MNFYRVVADPAAASRWFLREPEDASGESIDARLFTECRRFDVASSLRIQRRRPGFEVAFNFGDFDMPVTDSRLNDSLESLSNGGLQRIPVAIDSAAGNYEILNILDCVPCIDSSASVYTRWAAVDGRPDKTGQYRMITKLMLDPKRLAGHHVFRATEWSIAIIVSEQARAVIASCSPSGVSFQLVT